MCQNLEAQCAIFDAELSGSQIRNLEEFLQVEVLDRTMLILEIFARRAVTSEGKLQTELALLRYRLPRLAGLGQSLSRQGGGGGGGAGARRGAGESKLEYDRRHVRRRIEALSEKLAEVSRRREQARRSRQKSGVPVIALVGYTNVGKSSLLNRMCGAGVLEADMLFATLDPTARQLTLPSGLACVAVDTVGFVSRLPHHLVEAFQSTLEEAAYADVLVRVCDASDPESARQLAVTDEVLESLGCGGIPTVTVYNKCDKAPGAVPLMTDSLRTSAATGEGVDALAGKAGCPAGKPRAAHSRAFALRQIGRSLAHAPARHGAGRGVPPGRRVPGGHCESGRRAPLSALAFAKRVSGAGPKAPTEKPPPGAQPMRARRGPFFVCGASAAYGIVAAHLKQHQLAVFDSLRARCNPARQAHTRHFPSARTPPHAAPARPSSARSGPRRQT